jgi:hypothetical protein
MPKVTLSLNFNGTGTPENNPFGNNTHYLFMQNEQKKSLAKTRLLSPPIRSKTQAYDLPGVACDPDFGGKNPDQVLAKLLQADSDLKHDNSPIGQMFQYVLSNNLAHLSPPFFKKMQHVRHTINGDGTFSQALIALYYTYKEIEAFVQNKENYGQDLRLEMMSFSHSRGGVASIIYSNLVNEFILPYMDELKRKGALGPKSSVSECKVMHDTVIGSDSPNADYRKVMKDSVYDTFTEWKAKAAPTKKQQDIFDDYVKPPLKGFVKSAQIIYAQNETRYAFSPYTGLSFDKKTKVSKIILPEFHNSAIYGTNTEASLKPVGIIKDLSINSFIIKHNTHVGFDQDYGHSKIQAHYYLMLEIFQEYNKYCLRKENPRDFIGWCQQVTRYHQKYPEHEQAARVSAMLKHALNDYAEFKTRPEFFEKGTLTPEFMAFQSDSVRDLSGVNNEADHPRVFYDKFHEMLFYAVHDPKGHVKFHSGVNTMEWALSDSSNHPNVKPGEIDGEIPVRYPISSVLNAMGIESLRTKELAERKTSGRSTSDATLRDFLINPLSDTFIGSDLGVTLKEAAEQQAQQSSSSSSSSDLVEEHHSYRH